MSLNVLAIGASRNIGYFSALRLLDAGATVHFLLRAPNVFDEGDQAIRRYVSSGSARLLKGDGLVKSDVQRAWEEAGKERPVDVVIFSVGGIPKFDITKGGFVISPPDLVTRCLLNALCAMPEQYRRPSSSSSSSPLRFVVVTSSGITASSRASLPFPIKLLFKMIKQPHRDKVGAERIVHHVAGWDFDVKDFDGGEPGEDVLDPNWKDREGGLPESGSFDNFLVVRPALLTDGECVADKEDQKIEKKKAPYKASEQELGSYTISRRDTAHFIAQAVLSKWSEYGKKIINVGY